MRLLFAHGPYQDEKDLVEEEQGIAGQIKKLRKELTEAEPPQAEHELKRLN